LKARPPLARKLLDEKVKKRQTFFARVRKDKEFCSGLHRQVVSKAGIIQALAKSVSGNDIIKAKDAEYRSGKH
jgi:hypothetical protein